MFDQGDTLDPDAKPGDPDAKPGRSVERETRQSVLRGWRRRCPACGTGPLLKGYLKVHDCCPVCSEELYHHRADDGPAYLTILVVGHLMAPAIFWAFVEFRPQPIVLASVFGAGTVLLSLYLLPRLKGALIAMQWAKRMHGFAERPPAGLEDRG